LDVLIITSPKKKKISSHFLSLSFFFYFPSASFLCASLPCSIAHHLTLLPHRFVVPHVVLLPCCVTLLRCIVVSCCLATSCYLMLPHYFLVSVTLLPLHFMYPLTPPFVGSLPCCFALCCFACFVVLYLVLVGTSLLILLLQGGAWSNKLSNN